MTITQLRARGFLKNRNIPGFVGYCGVCKLYRPLDWWQSPESEHERAGQVVVCSYCQHLDARDERFVRGFPVVKRDRRHALKRDHRTGNQSDCATRSQPGGENLECAEPQKRVLLVASSAGSAGEHPVTTQGAEEPSTKTPPTLSVQEGRSLWSSMTAETREPGERSVTVRVMR